MNIKDDHLDYHKDISSYRDAKFEIFKTNSPVKLIHENISISVGIMNLLIIQISANLYKQ